MVDTVQTTPPDRNLLAIDVLIEKWRAGFDPYGPSGTSNQEFKTLDAYLRSIFGDLPEGAVDWDTGDLNGDGVNELYAVDANGNPHTVYGYDDNNEVESTVYSDYLRDTIYSGTAPQTWEDVERILRAEGYSDSEIASAEGSLYKTKEYSEWLEDSKNKGKVFYGIKYCHELKEVNEYDDDCQTRGSINLGYILGEFGYKDAGWWDARPTTGTGCTTSEGTAGKTNPDGTCREDPNQLPGASCPDGPHGSTGVLDDDGNCTFVEGNSCDPPKNPSGYGKINAKGDCVETADPPDCTVVTQENAEECGYEITSDGQLIPKDLDDPNLPNYTPCGGNIFVEEGTECPDVGGVTDCTLKENKNRPECQTDPDDEFQGLYDEFGKPIVDKFKGLYDKIKNKWDKCTDPANAVECVGELIRTILPGLSEPCKAGEEPGDTWVRDCVTVGMIIPIPGIDFPLPGGMSANATIGEIEDALKDSGKSFEDFLEDPIGTIQGVFGNVWDKIKDIWNSAEDKTWGNLIKILTDAGFGAIVGILGDRILDEIVIDSGNPFLPFTPVSCEQADYYEKNADQCFEAGYVDCTDSENSSGQETTGGIIQGTLDDCPVIQDPQCQDTGSYDDNPNSPTFGKCVCPEGSKYETEDFEEGCGGIVDTEVDCTLEENKDLPECKIDCTLEENKDLPECKEEIDCTLEENKDLPACKEEIDCTLEENKDLPACKEEVTPPGDLCGEGTELNGQPPEYDFNDLEKNGSYTFGGNQYTYDPCNPSQGPTLVTSDTNDDGGGEDPLDCAEITDENAARCKKEKCPDGTFVDEGASCGSVTNPCDDPVYASENEDECGTNGGFVVDCSEPRPIGTVTFDLIEQQRAWDLKCGDGGGGGNGGGGDPEVCDNGATVESGCQTCEDGTPVDSYEDGKCPAPVVPPTTTPPPVPPPVPPPGGGGGGGGGGGFTAEAPEISMGIEGDPELLKARKFPITDYLAGLFTGTGGGRV